jgi:hypothetical protein
MKAKAEVWRACADGRSAKPPFVYFIQAGGFVKIGWTMGPPERRALAGQIFCPHQFFLMGAIPGGKEEELWWHTAFEALHVRGEWFRLTERLRSAILFALKKGVEVNRPKPLNSRKAERVRASRRERFAALETELVTFYPDENPNKAIPKEAKA